VSIRDEILECTGRDVARGSIYITLDRLETKGYLRSRLADRTPERGGRSKRYYSLRPKAIDALKEGRRALVAPWRASKACWRDRSAAARRRRAAGGAGAFVSRDPRRSARRAARQLTVPLG